MTAIKVITEGLKMKVRDIVKRISTDLVTGGEELSEDKAKIWFYCFKPGCFGEL